MLQYNGSKQLQHVAEVTSSRQGSGNPAVAIKLHIICVRGHGDQSMGAWVTIVGYTVCTHVNK